MITIQNVTYLLQRRSAGPFTGIDRVEFAVASWLCAAGHENGIEAHFMVEWCGIRGLVPHTRMRRILARMLAERGGVGGQEALLEQVMAIMMRTADVRNASGAYRLGAQQKSHPAFWDRLSVALSALWGHWRLRSASRRWTDGTHYLHCSPAGLEGTHSLDWTLRHGALKTTTFIHDMIPLDFPEFCSEGAKKASMRRIETIRRTGAKVATNSRYSARRIEAHLGTDAGKTIQVRVHPLGCGPLAGTSAVNDLDIQPARCRPFFVAAGTLEGRKNIPTILRAWRILAARRDPRQMPVLVLAGSRGWSARELLADLDRMIDIGQHIVEVAGLTDQQLSALVKGARGAICASFAEGYSLFPADAAALCVPVLASNIPAHRELAAGKDNLFRLFPPKDAEKLALLVEELLDGSGLDLKSGTSRSWEAFARDLCLGTDPKCCVP